MLVVLCRCFRGLSQYECLGGGKREVGGGVVAGVCSAKSGVPSRPPTHLVCGSQEGQRLTEKAYRVKEPHDEMETGRGWPSQKKSVRQRWR